MSFRIVRFIVVCCFLYAALALNVRGQLGVASNGNKTTYRQLIFSTPAYREAAITVLLKEANLLAAELHSEEKLPIVRRDLAEVYIAPPRIGSGMKIIGTIATSNYVYAPYAGRSFSLVRSHLQREYDELRLEYSWPRMRMDTNSAFQLACELLGAAGMDVAGLNRNCRCSINAFTPEGTSGQHFVPLYWISWIDGEAPKASTEIFMPTKSLRQMQVLDPRYIMRKALAVPNAELLLSQTNRYK